MRIISGKYGGRRINPPSNMPHTRPTTDVAKEGLFNILQTRVQLDGANLSCLHKSALFKVFKGWLIAC